MSTTNENTSGATYVSGNTWKANDGTVFTTPSYSPPVYGTPIAILDGNGGSVAGTYINGEAVKNSTTS
jgi:hypothetical protein